MKKKVKKRKGERQTDKYLGGNIDRQTDKNGGKPPPHMHEPKQKY